MNFKIFPINFLEISSESKKIFEIISVFAIVIFALASFTVYQFPLTGNLIDTEGYKVIPLNTEQRGKVEQSVLASEFVNDLPKNDPVFLRFFSFESGERVWQDGFLVGREGILTQGNPSIYFSIHSKYIPELNEQNLCGIVQTANRNGDVGIYSDYSKARLFLKYVGMLKHRDCFGF